MVTLGLSSRDPVRLVLKELHGLPVTQRRIKACSVEGPHIFSEQGPAESKSGPAVTYRIQYKVKLLMFTVHSSHSPVYPRK